MAVGIYEHLNQVASASRLERKGESRAFSRCRICPYLAAMPVYDSLYCCKPDSIPLELAICMQPLKRSKKLFSILHVKSCTVVSYVVNHLTIFTLCPQMNHRLRSLRSILACIVEKFFKHIPHQLFVRIDADAFINCHLYAA